MADSARNYTDAELKAMEDYLTGIYAQAEKDLQKKFEKYLADFARLEMQNQKKVDAGEMSQEEFDEWRKNKLLYGTHWTKLIKQVQNEMSQCNQTAIDYVNGKVPQIFAVNYNQLAEVIDNSPVGGYTFELVNADTIKNLATGNEIILPPRKNMDIPKDKLWNAKLVNAQLMQGILQGESIPKMAARMANVCNSNLKAATRTARTMTTAAENSGRQSSINRATADGIILIKEWLATNDERTRDSHVAVNHERVRCDASTEKTKLFSNGLAFPADWHGKPSEVYNCRCTLITKYAGVDSKLLKAAIKRQDQIEKAKDETQVQREELMKRAISTIENANINWSGAPDGFKEKVLASIQNCPDYLLDVIADSMDNLDSMVFLESGTSHYTFGTGKIVICINDSSSDELIETFWHEFGHYIDDASVSGSGYGYIQYFEHNRLSQDENGNIITVVDKEEYQLHRIKSMLTTYDVYGQQLQTAIASDVNNVLKHQGIDNIYVVKVSEDEYGVQYILKNGQYYDTVNTIAEDTERLHKALKDEVNRITGRTELDNFMISNGMPVEPKSSDYYKTVIRDGEAIVVENYAGARDKYYNDLTKYSLDYARFTLSDKYKELSAQQEELKAKVLAMEKRIDHVTDTLDSGAYGMFNAAIDLGGHTPDYLVGNGLWNDEQIANVIMSEILQNENILELNNELNKETYNLIKEVLENERNFKSQSNTNR